ncbi:hypothetical protein CTAYLR_002902 [Chrysophaeum taylorii]|uniref:D-isomer specific 2-hydroxyacid dehydrogenase NAD-binding domain-containing protein n=1 Tax=Chrysophaeum taylorii TaxID=2483200 RepID=A0AAD7XPP4_9STRA|nr:hypothetical protein CTAYLR_002902 [Chrysophaeum taylorii]
MFRAAAIGAVAGTAALYYFYLCATRRKKKARLCCWVSSLAPAQASIERLRRQIAGTGWSLRVVGSLEEVPRETAVLVCGEVKAFGDAKKLGRLEALGGVIVPYAGIHPKIREALSRSNERRRGAKPIVVVNSHHNAPSTAEMAIALALAAAKRLAEGDQQLRANDWRGRGLKVDGAPTPLPVIPQLIFDGARVLVVGLGAVGSRVALALSAMGCDVHATSQTATTARTREVRVGAVAANIDVHPAADLATLLGSAKLVVLCLPLNAQTRGLFGENEFRAMPSDAVCVNVARGPIVDEQAVFNALQRGDIACYASDVWWHYPGDWAHAADCAPWTTNDANNGVSNSKNKNVATLLPHHCTLLSPHRGGAVGLDAAEERRMDAIAAALNRAARLDDFATGLATPPLGRVDLQTGY